jgi:hypothetical protein
MPARNIEEASPSTAFSTVAEESLANKAAFIRKTP